MKVIPTARLLSLMAAATLSAVPSADAHKLRERGVRVVVADSTLSVSPSQNWNRLDGKIGKNAESWTIDGGQLNDLTFYGGIAPGNPLVKERSKKRLPLPKFSSTTLLIEIPELLEGTYRAYKNIGTFALKTSESTKFLGQDGVHFTY